MWSDFAGDSGSLRRVIRKGSRADAWARTRQGFAHSIGRLGVHREGGEGSSSGSKEMLNSGKVLAVEPSQEVWGMSRRGPTHKVGTWTERREGDSIRAQGAWYQTSAGEVLPYR